MSCDLNRLSQLQEKPNRRHESTNDRKRSHRTGSYGDSNKKDIYSPKDDGLPMLYHIIRKLKSETKEDSIPWNDVRNSYRKECGRTLNSDELNIICGTSGKTKNELIHSQLKSILVPIDNKCLRIRLAFNSPSPVKNNGDSSPAATSTASAIEWQTAALDEQRRLIEKRRKELCDYLLRSGLATSEGGRLSASDSVGSARGISQDSDEIFAQEKDIQLPVEEDEVFDKKSLPNNNENTVEEENVSPEATVEEVQQIIFRAPSFQDEQEPLEEVIVEFELNSKDTVMQFEQCLLEHRNSIGSYDASMSDEKSQDIVTNSDQSDPSIVQETSIYSGTNAESSSNSKMNAAFLASESQQISFEFLTPCSESSGEQGYTTGKEQLTSPEMNGNSNVSDPDASLGMNGSDQQIEATLCSSRIEDDDRGAMPQPDVSPVTEGETDKDTTVNFRAYEETVFERPSLEERVPHLHYAPNKSDIEQKPVEEISSIKDNLVTEPTTAEDAETDDEFLYDDDFQVGDELPDLKEHVVENINDEIDGVPTDPPPPVAIHDREPEIQVIRDLPNDGASGDHAVVAKRKAHVRIARRRWFDCCALL